LKIKVLHIIDSFGVGGAEKWLLECVKYLYLNPHLNIQFDFLATSGTESVLDREVLLYGSKIYYSKFSKINVFKFSSNLNRILQLNKYDAIHNHQDFVAGIHFLLVFNRLPKIRITHLHNPYNFILNYKNSISRSITYSLGKKLMYLFSTKITGTSNFVLNEYGYNKFPYNLKRISPLYCGFDSERFIFNSNSRNKIRNELSWDADSKIALFVGRIGLTDNDLGQNQKNPEFAFSIAKILAMETCNWNFIFVGKKGRLGEFYNNEIVSLGIQNRIKFLDVRQDINDIYSASDVLLFPSFWEGLGMVAVEAQASGLKVVMSDSIPDESIVVNECVTKLNLQKPLKDWVNAIINAELLPFEKRIDQCSMISNSYFSIQNSVINLLKSYQN